MKLRTLVARLSTRIFKWQTAYEQQAQKVLEALLLKYADEGIEIIEEPQILTIAPFNQFGTPMEIVKAFGGIKQYHQALQELTRAIYS